MAKPSKSLKIAYPYLIVLANSIENEKLKKELLKEQAIVDSLSEIALNILKQNIPTKPNERKKLRKYKKELLELVQKGGTKKKQLCLKGQRGSGIITTLLSIGLPIIASLLANKKHGSKD